MRKPGEYGARLLSFRILFGKIAVSFLAILGGFTIGREGPTVQVGAALMFNLRRLYPRSNALIERQLVLAGAAAGLSAAFNTPLAGIVFAIEELTRSFEARASGVLITAIIIAGVIALGLNGNYTYFGTIQIGAHFPDLLAVAVLLTAIVTGIAGGVFGWLLLNTARWIPAPLRQLHGERPVVFAALCGFVIAVVGLISGGTTFGSGYAEARGLLDGHEHLSVFYPFLKMISMVGSYLPGIPGGIFAPSLSIGAGFGNLLHMVFDSMQLPMLIALAMVGYLAAVTQSPITSFVIVMEMIDIVKRSIAGCGLCRNCLVSSRTSANRGSAMSQFLGPTSSVTVTGMPWRRPPSGLLTITSQAINQVGPQLWRFDGLGGEFGGGRDETDSPQINLAGGRIGADFGFHARRDPPQIALVDVGPGPNGRIQGQREDRLAGRDDGPFLASPGQHDAVAGSDQHAVGQLLHLHDVGLAGGQLGLGRRDVFDPGAGLDHLLRNAWRISAALRPLSIRLRMALTISRVAAWLLSSASCRLKLSSARLNVASRRRRLPRRRRFPAARTVQQFLQRGFGVVALGQGQLQIIFEILIVERGYDLARLDRVSFVDFDRGDPSANLVERQVHLCTSIFPCSTRCRSSTTC